MLLVIGLSKTKNFISECVMG